MGFEAGVKQGLRVPAWVPSCRTVRGRLANTAGQPNVSQKGLSGMGHWEARTIDQWSVHRDLSSKRDG